MLVTVLVQQVLHVLTAANRWHSAKGGKSQKQRHEIGAKTGQNCSKPLLAAECLLALQCPVAYERGGTEPIREGKCRAQFERTECWNGCSVFSVGELRACQPLLLLSEVMWDFALLKCWYWSYGPEIPQNTPVSLAFYYPPRVQYVACLWAAQQQLSFCLADSFPPGAEADAHWRQAEGMSWESAENHSEQNELISWEKTGAEGVGRFQIVCVPSRLCVTRFNDFELNLFFN